MKSSLHHFRAEELIYRLLYILRSFGSAKDYSHTSLTRLNIGKYHAPWGVSCERSELLQNTSGLCPEEPLYWFSKKFSTHFLFFIYKNSGTLSRMEGELYNTIQKQELQGIPPVPPSPRFPDISFAPSTEGTPMGRGTTSYRREVCAKIGVVFGGIAIISWFVIALGIVFASLGVIFSYFGLTSTRAKHARIGLYLSLVGGVLSLLYILVVYAGLMNYNYFTNELWGIPSGGVQKFN